MRLVPCGELGGTVSQAFFREASVLPPSGTMPVALEVRNDPIMLDPQDPPSFRDRVFFTARISSDPTEFAVEPANAASYISWLKRAGAYEVWSLGHGSSPREAIRALKRALERTMFMPPLESFRITEVNDKRTRNTETPLVLNEEVEMLRREDAESRERMSQEFSEKADPELLGLLGAGV